MLISIISDLDGVLVQTEPIWDRVHQATVKHFGGNISSSFYREIGGTGMDHASVRALCIRESKISVGEEEYTRTFREYSKELLKQLTASPGAETFLKVAKNRGVRLALTTNSGRETADILLRDTGLEKYFETMVTGDDVPRAKPAPDCYLLALRKLEVSPEQAIAIEDSTTGIRSAASAGLEVIALRHEYNLGHDFSAASSVVNSFNEMEKYYSNSKNTANEKLES